MIAYLRAGILIFGKKTSPLPYPTRSLTLLLAMLLVIGYPFSASLALYPTMVLEHGQYARLLTGLLAHVNPLHLCSNLIALIIAGGYIEQRFGKADLLTLFLGAGVVGATCSMAWINAPTLGASSATYALCLASGLLAENWRDRASFGSWWALGMLSPLFLERIDWAAHVGGSLVALAFGLGMFLRRRWLSE